MIPSIEGAKNADVCRCLGLRRLTKELVSFQKNILHPNQVLRLIDNESSTVMRITLIHLLTQLVRQNEWQKQHEMEIVAGTRSAICLVLILQLPQDIGSGIVDGAQTCVGTVQQMTACYHFLSEQHAQTASQLVCSLSRNNCGNFYTLLNFSQNGLEERNYNAAVDLIILMHCIAHVHQVDAEVRDQSERVEEEMRPAFLRCDL